MKIIHTNAHKAPTLDKGMLTRIFPERDFATGQKRFATGSHLAAANSAAPVSENTQYAIGAANAEVAGESGTWVRISRYGEFWHAGIQATQVFNKSEAQSIVRAHRSTLSRLKERVIYGTANAIFVRDPKVPVYEGHPDVPGFAGRPGHEDTTPYANFTDFEARDDGLYGQIEWTAAGNALRASGKKLYFSPYWTLVSIDAQRSRPVRLLSVGMDPHPNISGSAANAQTFSQSQEHQPNHTMLKALLIALGLAEAKADAAANSADGAPTTDEAVAIVTDLQARADKSEALKTDLAAANAKATAEETAHAKTRDQLAAANAKATSERRARAEMVVDTAITEGRITQADREAEILKLTGAEDFTAAANAIPAKVKVVKTAAAANVDDRRDSDDRMNAAEAGTKVRLKAREIKAAANGKMDWDTAWGRALIAEPAAAKILQGDADAETDAD